VLITDASEARVDQRGSLGRAFAFSFATRIIGLLQGLVVMPIVIRLSGPATYGSFILVISALSFYSAIINTGLPYRYQRRLISASGPTERRQLFEPQFTFQLIAVVFFAALVVLVSPHIAGSLLGGDAHFTSWSIVALLVANLLYTQTVTYCLYRGRYTAFNVAWGGSPYVFLILLVVGAVTGLGLSLNVLLILQAISALCVGVALLPIVLNDMGIPRLRLPPRVLVADARLGFPFLLQQVVNDVLRFADRYLILLFLSVTAVGQYQPAFTVGTIVMVVPEIMGTVLGPSLAHSYDRGERRQAERLYSTALRVFLMIAAPFAIGTLLLGPSLLAQLTNTEIGMAGRWVMPLVAVGSLFFGVTRLIGQVAFVLMCSRMMLMATVIAAGIDIVLNTISLPLVKDISVAAVSILLGYVVSCLYLNRAMRALWRIDVDWQAVLRFSMATAVMGGVLWILGYRAGTVAPVSSVTLTGTVALGVFVYFLTLSVLGGFGRRELREIIDVLQGPTIATDADVAT
jgi:O-antigen/teichoic acid export membrane protein